MNRSIFKQKKEEKSAGKSGKISRENQQENQGQVYTFDTSSPSKASGGKSYEKNGNGSEQHENVNDGQLVPILHALPGATLFRRAFSCPYQEIVAALH